MNNICFEMIQPAVKQRKNKFKSKLLMLWKGKKGGGTSLDARLTELYQV